MTQSARTATTALLTITLWACSGANITKGEAASSTESQGENDESGPTEDSGHIDDPSAEDQPCAMGDPIMEMGTGEEEFLEIADGDEIEVIHGTQDGHHILGSLRTQNTADIIAVRFQIIPLSDGVAISDQTYRLLLLPDESGEPCTWSTVGMYAYLGRIDPGSAPFLDNPVEFRMDVVDDYGQALNQSLEVIPFLNPVDHDSPPPVSTGKR